MLRSDTTALFERLREANILLQEVLSGAHENMSALENTLVTRVSEFVSTMNEVAERSGVAEQPGRPAHHLVPHRHQQGARRPRPARQPVRPAWPLAGRGGRPHRESNRRTEETLGERRARSRPSSGARHQDRGHRAAAQALLRPARRVARRRLGPRPRHRPPDRGIEHAGPAPHEQFDGTQTRAERSAPARRCARSSAATPATPAKCSRSTTQRFTERPGHAQMAAEMQRELETTRTELRRGILELPQETAESAAQMRRVIVDQIEALAELNRIVARHGRGMMPPSRRAANRAVAAASTRAEAPRYAEPRMDAPRMEPPRMEQRAERPAPAPRPDITGARRCRAGAESPSLSPARPGQRPQRLAHRAPASRLARRRTAARREDRAPRRPARRSPRRALHHRVADSLSVDIARMIDHDAAAELWDRYKRGERNVFTRRLYTMQGQKTFDEIRKQYRARPRVQADRRPLYRRVRAAARRGLARRPRPGGGAHLPHLGDGQGLHHARPRRRPLRRVDAVPPKHSGRVARRARFCLRTSVARNAPRSTHLCLPKRPEISSLPIAMPLCRRML